MIKKSKEGYVLFESGNYEKKGFDISNPVEFKKLTEGLQEIPLINVHTSEHALHPDDIPSYGKFSDLENDGKVLKAYTFEYRDDRLNYLKDVDRLSVEIENGQIKKVAALKHGIEPAANTASLKRIEFSKSINDIKIKEEQMDEFNKLSFEEKIKLINTFLQGLSDTEKKLAKADLKLDLLEEKTTKTEEEIKQETDKAVEKVRQEFQRVSDCDKWFNENQEAIPPGMRAEFYEFAKDIYVNQSEKILEFSKESDGKKENVKLKSIDFLDSLVKNFGRPPQGRVEFSNGQSGKGTNDEETFKAAMEFTKGLYGTGGSK